MQRPPYSMHVFWSDEDEAYIAVCPEFDGMSAFGESPEEAARELNVAIDDAVFIFQEDGDALPEPRTAPSHSGQLRLRLPRSLHGRLAADAEREGVSLNTWILTLLAGRSIEASLMMMQEHLDRQILASAPTATTWKPLTATTTVDFGDRTGTALPTPALEN